MPSSRRALARCVEDALLAVEREQLSTGEIPNYRQGQGDYWEYCFSPLASALSYDALGLLDPLSSTFDAHALEQAAGDRRGMVGRRAARIRRRIRRFLAWQQRTDGTWRFYGHGSPLPSDLETTACATAALLDGSAGRTIPGLTAHGALRRFPTVGGLFHSPGSRDDAGPDSWGMRAANVHLLRCLILEGADQCGLDALMADAGRLKLENGAVPPLPFWYALGRAAQRVRIDGFDEQVRHSMEGHIVDAWSQARDRSTGPLACGLWLTVLIDFRCGAEPIAAAADRVMRWLELPVRYRQDAAIDRRCAGPGLTTAVGLAALARAAAFLELSDDV